jgi:hypothetical protein
MDNSWLPRSYFSSFSACNIFVFIFSERYISSNNVQIIAMNKSYQWRATQGEKLLRGANFEPKVSTEAGILVRSRNEQRIADFLFRKQITFIYEPVLQLDYKVYRPDFYLPDHQLYIEFFGWTHIPSYQQKTQEKIAAYQEHQIECIYLYLKGSRYLEDILENQLIEHNVLSPNIKK